MEGVCLRGCSSPPHLPRFYVPSYSVMAAIELYIAYLNCQRPQTRRPLGSVRPTTSPRLSIVAC